MAKSVLELAVGTGQWDAGLKKAKNALDNFTQANGGLQKALATDSDKMQQFVKMMGQMDSTAKTAKGQMNDYKGTIEQLTMQYNRMTDAQKAAVGQTYLQAIDQMKQKYQGVAQEVAKINQELKQTNEISADKLSGMLQVFGGNVMTKVAGMGVGFVSELGDMVKQGIELARQGEGIRIAFERLNKPGLLDNLREATHGTLTNLELMKAAVQFNDFKLPLEELGTMLAFAQQKAKDTGQSVDYMAQSIVTGLGRKSVMILDNLGLSAAEIKEKMKDTGDMTKAVGEIIREQMAKAGDYVETAADRANKANVSLKNKMEELGRKFGPLEQASSNLWTSIKIGIMDIVGGPLTEFINKLTEAGRLAQQYGVLGGTGKVGRMINNLSGAREGNRQSVYQQQQEQFWRYINPREQQIRDIQAWQRGERGEALQKRVSAITDKYGSLDATKIRAEVDAAKKMLNEYIQGAKAILEANPAPSSATTTTTTSTTTSGKGNNGNPFDLSKVTFDTDAALLGATKGIDGGPSDIFAAYKESLKEQMDVVTSLTEAFKRLNEAEDVDTKEEKKNERRNKRQREKNPYLEYGEDGKTTVKLNNVLSGISSGISQMADGLESMGIQIPDEIKSSIGILQGMSAILTGISTTLLAIEALSAADTFLPFAHGGKVPHAANGYFVQGTRRSTDTTPILANAGELVLNESSQDNLALGIKNAEALVQTIDRYQDSVMRGSQAAGPANNIKGGNDAGGGSPYLTGEVIYLGLSAYLKSSGRGEIVTSRSRG